MPTREILPKEGGTNGKQSRTRSSVKTSIRSETDRNGLKPRREPYWERIRKGCYLGFRRMSTAVGSGTWVARCLNPIEGKQQFKSLGDFREVRAVSRRDAALEAANEWFAHLGRGGSANATTVRSACERYVEHLKETKGDKAAADASARFKAYVLDQATFAETELTKLTSIQIQSWRRTLKMRRTTSGANRGGLRSDSTLNRDMTCLRAALNLAFDDKAVSSDLAWRNKLAPIKSADRRRNDYLTADQRRQLIACADDDLGYFLRGMSLLPIRPGALAALTVSDFDRNLRTLRIGTDKAGQDRIIALPDQTARLIERLCLKRLPGAPIFMRNDGRPWDKDSWKYPVRAAVEKAGLPDSITAYTIRHSVITDLIHSGLDALTVAQLSGTSVRMIEQHYGHLTQEHARRALAKLAV